LLGVPGSDIDARLTNRAAAGSGGPTEEPGELANPGQNGDAGQSDVHRQAQEIAARLSVPRPEVKRRGRRGGAGMISAPFDAGSDEIDLDRTFEAMLDGEIFDSSRVIVRHRRRIRRALALIVDTSGSMRGERVKTTAATVGALAAEFADEQLAVIAFWSDAAVLLELGAPVDTSRLIADLLALPGQGLTNISFPLEVAGRALAGRAGYERRAMLLSDCLHNAGPDPRIAAARLPRLDVLLDVSGEHDLELGRELAREGRGRVGRIRDHRDVAGAINSVFAP
jgi:Mg-chelatase subunit ChlD